MKESGTDTNLHRGAPGSKGKTSWSGKAEQEDYTSVAGLLIHYLQFLSLLPYQPLTPSTPTSREYSDTRPPPHTSHPSSKPYPPFDESITILLAGYSYGSLTTSNLPPTSAIISRFTSSTCGSAAQNVLLRARTLSAQTNETLSSHRGRQTKLSSPPAPHHKTLSHPIVYGGDESPSPAPAAEDSGKRSADIVRRSTEIPQRIKQHIRKRSSRSSIASPTKKRNPVARAGSSSTTISTIESRRAGSGYSTSGAHHSEPGIEKDLPRPQSIKTAYLLISPLLPPLSSLLVPNLPSFLTSYLWKTPSEPRSQNLLQNPTLNVFGSEDGFTAAKKLCVWGGKMQALSATFEWREIEGAGHFWKEQGVDAELRDVIRTWVERVLT